MLALVWDTETTGLPKHRRAKLALQPRVIEFGAVLIDERGTEVDSLNIIIDPEQEIEEVITKITGLTNDDLRGKPKFHEVLPQIEGLFRRADIMIAHNLPFDSAILGYELERCGVQEFHFPGIRLCTVQENLPAWGRRPKLTELYEHVMGKPLAQTHRALDDCRALAEIVIKEKYIEAVSAAARKD